MSQSDLELLAEAIDLSSEESKAPTVWANTYVEDDKGVKHQICGTQANNFAKDAFNARYGKTLGALANAALSHAEKAVEGEALVPLVIKAEVVMYVTTAQKEELSFSQQA